MPEIVVDINLEADVDGALAAIKALKGVDFAYDKVTDSAERVRKTTERTGQAAEKSGKQAKNSATETNQALEILEKGYNAVIGVVTTLVGWVDQLATAFEAADLQARRFAFAGGTAEQMAILDQISRQYGQSLTVLTGELSTLDARLTSTTRATQFLLAAQQLSLISGKEMTQISEGMQAALRGEFDQFQTVTGATETQVAELKKLTSQEDREAKVLAIATDLMKGKKIELDKGTVAYKNVREQLDRFVQRLGEGLMKLPEFVFLLKTMAIAIEMAAVNLSLLLGLLSDMPGRLNDAGKEAQSTALHVEGIRKAFAFLGESIVYLTYSLKINLASVKLAAMAVGYAVQAGFRLIVVGIAEMLKGVLGLALDVLKEIPSALRPVWLDETIAGIDKAESALGAYSLKQQKVIENGAKELDIQRAKIDQLKAERTLAIGLYDLQTRQKASAITQAYTATIEMPGVTAPTGGGGGGKKGGGKQASIFGRDNAVLKQMDAISALVQRKEEAGAKAVERIHERNARVLGEIDERRFAAHRALLSQESAGWMQAARAVTGSIAAFTAASADLVQSSVTGMVATFQDGFTAILSGTASFSAGMASMMGQLIQQMASAFGEFLILAAGGMEAFGSLNWIAAIAAGIALSALAGAIASAIMPTSQVAQSAVSQGNAAGRQASQQREKASGDGTTNYYFLASGMFGMSEQEMAKRAVQLVNKGTGQGLVRLR